MSILQGFLDSVVYLFQVSGLATLTWENYAMVAIACALLYLAIKKGFEPLLLLPIAIGMLLLNLFPSIMGAPSTEMIPLTEYLASHPDVTEATIGYPITTLEGIQYVNYPHNGGLFYYLYQGVKLGIYPPLIFLGIGAMTDFGPLISNPKSFILGAAAQVGIFITFIGAIGLNVIFPGMFSPEQAGAIGSIGGADGPTAIYVATKLAPELLGPIAVAAYSYMALVPIIQPPIMKALTTKKERSVVMEVTRPVSKLEKILFPIIVTIVIALILPDAAPLVGMLMLGNLFKESGVVDRIFKTAQNELMNIVTIFLGISVGATATAANFLNLETIKIMVMGVCAFALGTAGGVLLAKFMNLFMKNKINPLIGSAGVSAVPMAARVSQVVGQKENPKNFLLMHAMGPNVAGVIGSAVAAGVFLALFG